MCNLKPTCVSTIPKAGRNLVSSLPSVRGLTSGVLCVLMESNHRVYERRVQEVRRCQHMMWRVLNLHVRSSSEPHEADREMGRALPDRNSHAAVESRLPIRLYYREGWPPCRHRQLRPTVLPDLTKSTTAAEVAEITYSTLLGRPYVVTGRLIKC